MTRRVSRGLAWATLFCAMTVVSAQATPAPRPPPVRASGETQIAAALGKIRVSATLLVHQVSIGRTSDPPPKRRTSNCTYSRIPCAVVDALQLRVNGADVFVPRSAMADLSDVNTARLRALPRGRFELVLNGGDASEAYDAHIVFDRRRVLERTLIASEAGIPAERTTYFDVSKAFN
jgi:hypothetical protein